MDLVAVVRCLSGGRSMASSCFYPGFLCRTIPGFEQVLSVGEYDLILYNIETAARHNECLSVLPRGEQLDRMLTSPTVFNDAETGRLVRIEIPTVLILPIMRLCQQTKSTTLSVRGWLSGTKCCPLIC